MQEKTFKYELGSDVKLQHSDEEGQIIARAEYLYMENSYFVRYMAGDGRQVEHWWGESALHQGDEITD